MLRPFRFSYLLGLTYFEANLIFTTEAVVPEEGTKERISRTSVPGSRDNSKAAFLYLGLSISKEGRGQRDRRQLHGSGFPYFLPDT